MAGRFDATGYLSPHSDVAAHLVFTHQMHMMNLITRVGWQTRVVRADQGPEAARTTAAARPWSSWTICCSWTSRGCRRR